MDEMEYYRALGIDPPADEGAKEQEAADPAEDQETGDPAAAAEESGAEDGAKDAASAGEEGENRQELADPAQEEADDTPPEQTPEERRRHADARRRRERREAEERARGEERDALNERLKKAFAWAGFKDGDKPIETLEEFEAYQQRAAAAKMEHDLQAGKLTPEMLRQTVAEEIARQTPKEPTAEEGQPPEAFRRQVEAELAEIRRYEPEVQSVEDLLALDRADEFRREVAEHNHTFLEAYRITYADKIAAAKAAAAAQRTRNAERSKAHMQPVGTRGAGDTPVPAEVRQMYRAYDPDMTDEEIRRDYQRYEKTKRR